MRFPYRVVKHHFPVFSLPFHCPSFLRHFLHPFLSSILSRTKPLAGNKHTQSHSFNMFRRFDPHLPLSLLPPRTGDNDVDALALLNFVSQLYYPPMDQSYYNQLYTSVALITILMILLGAVILNRLFHGRAWFLKIWNVAGGTFVLPNSVIAFLVCQGIYACCWIGYVFLTVEHYQHHRYSKNYFLYKVLVWVPLWDGGWWTAFGVLSAFPDALTLKPKDGRQRRLLLSPTAFNIACWLTPVLQVASVLPAAILACQTYNASFDDFDAWKSNIDMARQHDMTDATFSVLHTSALHLWLGVTKTYWYLDAAMTCWSIWAVICLCVYVPIGAHTLSRIHAQLKLSKREEQKPKPTFRMKVVSDEGDVDQNCQGESQHQRSEGVGCSSSRVFPPMKESSKKPQARTVKPRSLAQRRTHNLKRVHRNISVQYYGITCAIICFFVSSSIYAIGAYDCARNNKVGPTQVRGDLSAAWVSVCFGFLVMCCIFWRSFDPSLSIDLSDEEGPTVPARSMLVGLVILAPARMMVAAAKTRPFSLRSPIRAPDLERQALSPAIGKDADDKHHPNSVGNNRVSLDEDVKQYVVEGRENDTLHRKASSLTLVGKGGKTSIVQRSPSIRTTKSLAETGSIISDKSGPTTPTSDLFPLSPREINESSDAQVQRPSNSDQNEMVLPPVSLGDDDEDFGGLEWLHNHCHLVEESSSSQRRSISSFRQWRRSRLVSTASLPNAFGLLEILFVQMMSRQRRRRKRSR